MRARANGHAVRVCLLMLALAGLLPACGSGGATEDGAGPGATGGDDGCAGEGGGCATGDDGEGGSGTTSDDCEEGSCATGDDSDGGADSSGGECEPSADTGEGEIKNPYYDKTEWRLWSEDASPVSVDAVDLNPAGTSYAPTPIDARWMPDPSAPIVSGSFLEVTPFDEAAGISGWWDDGYATFDDGHTVIDEVYEDEDGNDIDLTGQFIRVPTGALSWEARRALGINFGSRSLEFAGHQYVDDGIIIEELEREFFFCNIVHGSPAFKSLEETLDDKALDSYDGLFAHAYNGIGRSGSELTALMKMLIAGGHVPRATKDLIKRHGAWAAALLDLWKTSLPYVDDAGNEVPYASELRHRPAYQSRGDNHQPPDTEFILHNLSYHEYSENEHLLRMVKGAKAMSPPPITILRVVDITVKDQDGAVLVDAAPSDPRLMSQNKTNVRVWGGPGETIVLRVDLGDSYDLLERGLDHALLPVYLQQNNIVIEREGCSSIFRVTVAHDPALPKGRLPILAQASAEDGTGGTPAFVNFYWPEPGQQEKPPYFHPTDPGRSNDPLHEVNRNLRPIITLDPAAASNDPDPSHHFTVQVGTPVEVHVSCADPEGFETRLYQWSTDAVRLQAGVLSHTPTDADLGKVASAHIICSDQTGGTSSALVRIEAFE